jgi:hypothetical protein
VHPAAVLLEEFDDALLVREDRRLGDGDPGVGALARSTIGRGVCGTRPVRRIDDRFAIGDTAER